ncbi:MAG: hypothetical protein AMS19_02885, partial [Gemmatimonas sp. SG8_23]
MPSSPSTEQLLVQVLLRAAQELLRALEPGEDDASAQARARHELELAFIPIWSRLPVLDLACVGDEVLWNGVVVLSREADVCALVPTLARSGIHALRLVPGVERDEMARLLELVSRAKRLDEDGDQDLVLMLFRADLHHVSYTVGPVDASLSADPAFRG